LKTTKPIHPHSAWRVIRRELLIGLAWGVLLAVFVAYPLFVKPAYQDAEGRIGSYPPGVHRDTDGNRIFLPNTYALSTTDWTILLAKTCGTVILMATFIGLLVGVVKFIRRA
jgi:Mg/Co/Ni transporter MgtE